MIEDDDIIPENTNTVDNGFNSRSNMLLVAMDNGTHSSNSSLENTDVQSNWINQFQQWEHEHEWQL